MTSSIEQAKALMGSRTGSIGIEWANVNYLVNGQGLRTSSLGGARDGFMIEMASQYRENPVNSGGGWFYRSLGLQYSAGSIGQIKQYGSVNIAEQEQMPENPGIRREAFSTYGINIPLSTGARRIVGNIIDADPLVPRMVGTHEKEVTYKVPVTIINDFRCAPKEDEFANECTDDECDPTLPQCKDIPPSTSTTASEPFSCTDPYRGLSGYVQYIKIEGELVLRTYEFNVTESFGDITCLVYADVPITIDAYTLEEAKAQLCESCLL